MCGIAGFQSERPCLSKILQQSLMAIMHRGPDDSGIFEDPGAGIGMVQTRLAIMDLSPLGHQPMHSADGRVVIVFNGEIYNFRELRFELEQQGGIFCGQSDTEVLLQLYLFWRHEPEGIARMLRQLNGIFVFAIWDADREALLLARDAFGVKPLYYSANEDGFAFASEIKALSPLLGAFGDEHLMSHLNITAIDRYLTYLWCPGLHTPSLKVNKLLPGQAMWVKQGQVVESFAWFQLPPFRLSASQIQQRHSMSSVDAIHGTEHHLRQAVHRQMVADVPVGAFLSGGLDSSSVIAFAREKSLDIPCFTIETTGASEEGIIDDLPYARRVAAYLNVPLEVVRIDAAKMAEDLQEMVTHLDEPLADPAPLNVLYISRRARENGIKVLLSGAGGDDLFSGYRRHRALMAEGYWSWLPKTARAELERLTHKLNQKNTLGRRLRKLFNGASLDGDARLVNYFRWIDRQDLSALYTAEFRAALRGAAAEEPMLHFLATLPPETCRLERMLALEQRFFLTDHNLNYTDKMSMAAGVEVRVPFLDLDLVDFAACIPARFKQRGSESKWVLKKAMKPYLPKDVIYRPKSGFGAPLRRWMRMELRDLLAEVLSEKSLRNRGLFDPASVQRLVKANDEGQIDASYTLLSLMCIELWCRRF